MRLVFTGYFNDTVSRLNGLGRSIAERSRSGDKSQSSGAASFGEALSRAQNQAQTTLDASALTDLGATDSSDLDARLDFDGLTARLNQTAERLFTNSVTPAGVPTESIPDNVKNAESGVKNVAQGEGVPTTIPSAPVIVQARWTAERTYRESTKLADGIQKPTSSPTSALARAARSSDHHLIRNIISDAGKSHGVDPVLSLAIASVESGLDTKAISKDGHASKGIFQLLDSTGQEMAERLGVKEQYDPFNPSLNANLGVGYMRHLLDLFSEESDLGNDLTTKPAKSSGELEKLALAAFNAGQGSVARAQQKALENGKDPGQFNQIEAYLPSSTRAYVERVSQLRKDFENIV